MGSALNQRPAAEVRVAIVRLVEPDDVDDPVGRCAGRPRRAPAGAGGRPRFPGSRSAHRRGRRAGRRSTLVRALAGVARPARGHIPVNGDPVTVDGDPVIHRLTDLGYVPRCVGWPPTARRALREDEENPGSGRSSRRRQDRPGNRCPGSTWTEGSDPPALLRRASPLQVGHPARAAKQPQPAPRGGVPTAR